MNRGRREREKEVRRRRNIVRGGRGKGNERRKGKR